MQCTANLSRTLHVLHPSCELPQDGRLETGYTIPMFAITIMTTSAHKPAPMEMAAMCL